jgi:phosphohistidine phosphatase
MAGPARHRLFLLRHAKSSWDDPTAADHDRPLAPRGIDAADRLRRHFDEAGLRPDVVLCSSARRAVATLDGIRPALPPHVDVRVESHLYTGESAVLLDRLRTLSEDVGAALVVGHNPAIGDLAVRLTAGVATDADAFDRMRLKFPTGACATVRVDGPWARLNWRGATLDSFVIPRDL